jgi:hypothetical protein
LIDKRRRQEGENARLRKDNSQLERKIQEDNAILKVKMEPINKLREEYEALKLNFTPDNLKKVYAYFEKKSNDSAAYVVEALIGLMRNQRRSDPKSVELYIKKHEGFMAAINRVEPKTVNGVFCEEHLNNLAKNHNKVIDQEEFAIFRPYRDFLTKMCELGVLCKDEVLLENSIEENSKKLESNHREIEQNEQLL